MLVVCLFPHGLQLMMLVQLEDITSTTGLQAVLPLEGMTISTDVFLSAADQEGYLLDSFDTQYMPTVRALADGGVGPTKVTVSRKSRPYSSGENCIECMSSVQYELCAGTTRLRRPLCGGSRLAFLTSELSSSTLRKEAIPRPSGFRSRGRTRGSPGTLPSSTAPCREITMPCGCPTYTLAT